MACAPRRLTGAPRPARARLCANAGGVRREQTKPGPRARRHPSGAICGDEMVRTPPTHSPALPPAEGGPGPTLLRWGLASNGIGARVEFLFNHSKTEPPHERQYWRRGHAETVMQLPGSRPAAAWSARASSADPSSSSSLSAWRPAGVALKPRPRTSVHAVWVPWATESMLLARAPGAQQLRPSRHHGAARLRCSSDLAGRPRTATPAVLGRESAEHQAVLSAHRLRTHWVSVRQPASTPAGPPCSSAVVLPAWQGVGPEGAGARRAEFDHRLPRVACGVLVDQQLAALRYLSRRSRASKPSRGRANDPSRTPSTAAQGPGIGLLGLRRWPQCRATPRLAQAPTSLPAPWAPTPTAVAALPAARFTMERLSTSAAIHVRIAAGQWGARGRQWTHAPEWVRRLLQRRPSTWRWWRWPTSWRERPGVIGASARLRSPVAVQATARSAAEPSIIDHGEQSHQRRG